MKKTYNFAILVLVIMVLSCKKDIKAKVKIVTKFPEKIAIQGKSIEEISVLSGGNVNLVVVDSFLVIQKHESKYFQIYSTKTHKLLAEFGEKGRGPNEFISPELLNQVSENSLNCFVYDYTRRRFTKIKLLNAVKDHGEVFVQKRIPKINRFLSYFQYKDDDVLIASPENKDRFIIYNAKDNRYKNIPYLPETDFEIPNKLKPIFYRSTSVVNRKLNLMASAAMFFGQIDFFSLKGEYLNSTVFESNEDLLQNLKSNDGDYGKLKTQIVDMDSKGNYIYCLNYNNSSKQLYEKNSVINKVKIQVFDWSGDPVKEYILNDERFISAFAFDEKHNRFYGYCGNEKFNTIIAYDLIPSQIN